MNRQSTALQDRQRLSTMSGFSFAPSVRDSRAMSPPINESRLSTFSDTSAVSPVDSIAMASVIGRSNSLTNEYDSFADHYFQEPEEPESPVEVARAQKVVDRSSAEAGSRISLVTVKTSTPPPLAEYANIPPLSPRGKHRMQDSL